MTITPFDNDDCNVRYTESKKDLSPEIIVDGIPGMTNNTKSI
jgi:hypothetical protein